MSCQSCGADVACYYLYFNDGGPTFSICDSCARSAYEHGVSVLGADMPLPTELFSGGER